MYGHRDVGFRVSELGLGDIEFKGRHIGFRDQGLTGTWGSSGALGFELVAQGF